MIINNIKNRIKQIKLYEADGSQTILAEDHARTMIQQIPDQDLKNPKTTYCDPQCGTGTLLLVLADVLMDKLSKVIPNESERLKHIFTKQLFGIDVNQTQVLLAKSNLKRAVLDPTLECNIALMDCFKFDYKFNYVLSNPDFGTIAKFVPKWRKQCKKLIITGRANQGCYTDSKKNELTAYQYFSKSRTDTLLCMMVFEPEKDNNIVKIMGDDETLEVENPPFLPDNDIKAYKYALEVCNCNFKTYQANYGSYYRTDPELNLNGSVPLIFNVGKYGEDFSDVLYVRKNVITEKEGVGLHKIVVSKNGIHKHQSPVKYAGPEYGTGHNTLWIKIDNKNEFESFLQYYQSDPVVTLCQALKSTMPANGITFWNRIPHLSNYKQIKKIYDKYYG